MPMQQHQDDDIEQEFSSDMSSKKDIDDEDAPIVM